MIMLLQQAGYRGAFTPNNFKHIIEYLTTFHCVDVIQVPLKDFCRGLNVLGVHDAITKHPEVMWHVFCGQFKTPLTAECLIRLIQPMYTPTGSNSRGKEELAMVYFRDYVQDCG